MRKRPFLLLACMFLAGIMLGITRKPVFIGPVILLYFYAMPWKERGIRKVLFAAGLPLLFLLGLIHTNREIAFRERCLQRIEDGQEVRLAGKIDRIESKTRCFYYYLTDCTISLSGEHVPCNDVIAYVSADDYSIGQIMVIEGTISLFDKATNEGAFDTQNFYQSQKIDFGLWVNEVCSVYKSANPYRQFLVDVRERLRGVLDASAEDDGVLAAMLLGDKSTLDTEVKSLYQKAGISHILAISGLHVSLLGIGLYRFLRRRAGLPYPASAAATAAFMFSYAVMSGNGISTRRAVGMLSVYLLAEVLGRAYDMLNALGVVVIILLWENPFLTGYSGFLFSVAAVLGIGIGGSILTDWRTFCCKDKAEPIRERGKEQSAKSRICERGRKMLCAQRDGIWVSVAIQLFTLPLVACYYYEIPVYAMIINLFVLGLVSYLLVFGAAGAVSGMFVPAIGKLLLFPCSWILWLYQWLCRFFVELPGAQYITGKPSVVKIVLYYFGLAGVLLVLWGKNRRCRRMEEKKDTEMDLQGRKRLCLSRSKSVKTVRFAVSVAVLLLFLFFPDRKEFEIDVLDVGQGDGIYLCTSDGVSMFIDGGSSDISQVGTYRILPFLKSRGIKKISYWFVSHTDEDHISGIREVMSDGYRIENLVLAEAVREDEKTQELAALAAAFGTKIVYMEAGDSLNTGQARLNCLYPAADTVNDDVNDLCLVLCLEDSAIKGMFAGDISSDVEQLLAEQGICGKVDFFKANHHGSKYSNSDEFLALLSPEITVASAGSQNRYGHPSAEAVERIRASGSDFWCTAETGQIKIRCKEKKLDTIFPLW